MPGSDISSAELRQQVLKLALPAASEQVLSVLVNMVNTALVGHLGASALTAVGLSGTITALASVFFGAVSTGGTALIAQAIGAKKPALANRVLGQALMVGAALGLLGASVLLPFARQSLSLMGAQGESGAMGVRYITCLALAVPFTALLMVGNAALRGSGDTRTPMTIMGAINLVNLALSYLLIRGVGPLPELGVTGAGIAAAVANVTGALAVLTILMRGRGVLRLARLVSRPDRAILAQLLRIGLPAGGESLLMQFAFMIYARSISSLGTASYAAYIVAQRIESFSTMPAFGFAAAATTLSGQALGARDPQRARRSVLEAVKIAVSFSLCVAVCTWTFPRALASLFTQDQSVINLAIPPLRVVGFAQPIMAIAFSLSGGLRGAGDTRSTMVITGIGAWLVRVPLAILSVTWLNWGLAGVQSSMMADWLTRALCYAWRFRPAMWAKRAAALVKANA